MKNYIVILLIMAVAGTALGFSGHSICVSNTTGETVEVCIYPYNPFYYETDPCFFVRNGEQCVERKIYFEDSCGYDICAYGSDSRRNYGCAVNDSCIRAEYTFSYGGTQNTCEGSYCEGHNNWVIEPSAAVSCFISATEF